MKLKLQSRYSLTFISLILFIVLVLSGTLLFRFKKSFGDLTETSCHIMADELLEQMKHRGTVIAQLLAENLVNPIYLNDMAKMQSLIQSVVTQKDIAYVYIYDENGNILHDGTESVELFGKKLNNDLVKEAAAQKNLSITRIHESMLEVAQSIWLDDVPLGGIILGMDLDGIFNHIDLMTADLNALKKQGNKNNIVFLGLLTMALIALGAILAVLMAGRLIRPIKEVTRYAEKVGQGSYDFELLTPYDDEIGDLVKSFNRMKSDLKDTTISIHELENEVAGRTREIQNTNEKLVMEIAVREKVEQELVQHKEALEDQVRRRTKDLTITNEKLKKEIQDRIHAEEQREKMLFQLKQAQKMEAIGTLAGGVAHDLNNILSGIISYPEMMLLELPKDNPHRELLELILESGQKAAAIVHDLLTLARRGVDVKEIINLKEIITQYTNSPELKKMMSYHGDVSVDTRFSNKWLGVIGSPVHFHKIIMNLVTNAAEAMPRGGEIKISVDKINVTEPMKVHPIPQAGEYVHLRVSDTGVGIDEADIEKIFDPFFTRKTMERSGTGLGMSVVWGAVKDHDGYIDVNSALGKGTEFNLYFPAIPKEPKKEQPKKPIDTYDGVETVLVVDDLVNQRKIAHTLLSKRGYAVMSVSSGEEAVAYLKDHTADLMLLDMIMKGGMDGLDTYREIIKFRPDQKVVIVSGYTETSRIKEAMKLGAAAFLKKPYLMEELVRCVRQELDR